MPYIAYFPLVTASWWKIVRHLGDELDILDLRANYPGSMPSTRIAILSLSRV